MNGDSLKDFLDKYGYPISEEGAPKLTKKKKPSFDWLNTPKFYTPEEAKEEYGYEIEEGWQLKLSPADNDEGFTRSLINPQGWELLQDQSWMSPEGEKYSPDEMTDMLAKSYYPSETEYTGLPPMTPERYQREKKSYEFEQVLGNVFPDRDIDELLGWVGESDANMDEFLFDISEIGRDPETESLLKAMFKGVDETQLSEIFEPVEPGVIPEVAITEQGEHLSEGIIKDTWDAVYLGLRRLLHRTGQYFVSVLPSYMFPPIEPGEIPITGTTKTIKLTPEEAKRWGTTYEEAMELSIEQSEQRKAHRDRFRAIYTRRQDEFDEWLRGKPELQPKPEYLEGVTEHPELLKDPGYWGWAIADSSAYTLAVMGTTLGVGFVTKNPYLALAAGTAVATPSASQDLYEDLIASGAPEDEAVGLSVPVGFLIASIESVTDLPFLAAVSPAFNILKIGVKKALVKQGVKAILKSGLKKGATISFTETFLEEVPQSVIQNAVVKLYDENRGLFEDVDETIIRTLIATLPFAIFGGGMTMRHVSQDRANTITDDQKARDGWEQDEITEEWYEPVKMVDYYDDLVAGLKDEGADIEEARLSALNEIAKTTEGEEAIRDYVEEIKGSKKTPEMELPKAGLQKGVIKVTEKGIIIGEGLDAGSIRKLKEGTFQVTPSYNQQTKGLKREIFKTEQEAISYAREIPSVPKVTPEIKPTIPKVEPTIPKAEPGMPEAGLQRGMFGEAKEVRPVGKGKVTQISMEEQLKLEQARRAEGVSGIEKRITEIDKLLETKGRLPKGKGTKLQLRIERARLEAERDIAGIDSLEGLRSARQEIETELGNRSLPYHGGAGAGAYTGWITPQLDEMVKVYREAEARLTRKTGEAKPIVKAEEVSDEDARLIEQLNELDKMANIWRQKLKTVEAMKTDLAKFVSNNLPPDVRGKYLTAVSKVKSEAQLQKNINAVRSFAEKNAQKALKARIKVELKKAAAKIKKHILRGKFTPEVQRRLDVINHNLELDRDTARAKMAENMQAYDDGKMSWEDMIHDNELLNFAGIDGMSSQELANTLEYIKILETIGRSDRQAKAEAFKERIDGIRTQFSNILTGGKGLKTGVGAVSRGQLAAKPGWLDTFVNWQYGIDSLADKLSKFDPTSKPYQSEINKFVAQVHRATNRQGIGTKEAFNKFKDIIKKVYGIKSNRDINHVLNALDEEVDLGVFQLTSEYIERNWTPEMIQNNPGLVTFELKMTRDQMIAKYMQMQDTTLNNTFTTGMGWSQQVRDSVKNNLTEQEKQVADAIFEFYEEYYKSINPIYQEIYNVDLPHNANYSPIRRDFESEIAENVLTLKDAAQFASVLNGSLKSRTRNLRPLVFNGATRILSNHIQQMEHFKAWANTMRDLRSVFGNKEVRQAIEQYHGIGITKLTDTFMNQMARGGIETAATNRVADYLRRAFTKSILAIKPVIALKQIPSLFAYVSEMNTVEFFGGIANFWASPVANFKFLYANSEGYRARVSQGFERDIRASMEKHGNKLISSKGSFTDWFLLQIRAGDTFAVTQGMWAKYKAGLKQGLSQQEAIAAAEDTTNRTQPSFGIDTLSAIQNGGSWLKLMTMFQNQPNKYFRIVGDNMRNFKYGRGSHAKSASTILLAWVILPMLFQFIADAFQWKPERQARAGILGPLNFILIGGQLVQSMWGWLTDQPFDYQISPVAQTGRDLQMIFLKAKKLLNQGLDPYKDIDASDVAALVEFLAKAGGQVTGLPTPYFVQVEKLIRHKFEEGEAIQIKDFLFSEWALEPPAKNAEQKVEDASLKLGEPKEGEEDAPLSERELKYYTTVDWFRDIGSIYSKVLPQDVLNNPKASKESKAWAEFEIARSQADILPDTPLYKINTEDNEDTIINYYQQWQARQRITSLAELNEYDKLYPKAYLGNVDRTTYDLLRRYLEAEDKDTILENHPELKVNLRDEWLKANPRGNALLALGGEAKILTIEAYNECEKMIKELDIPESAIPELTLPPKGSVDNYFEYREAGEEYGWNSAEARLAVANDDVLREWLGREAITVPVESLELQVKWRDESDKRDAWGNRESPLYIVDDGERQTKYDEQYANNPDFRDDMRRVEGYGYEFPDDQIENYVEYYNLQEKGYEQERYLIANGGEDLANPTGFYKAMIDLKDKVPFDLDYKVPDAQYDVISREWEELFEEYENVIGTESERELAREAILRDNPEFRKARRRREAYGKFIPEGQVEDYVEYYEIPPKSSDEWYVNHSNETYYEDDWFLQEHPEFYDIMTNAEIMGDDVWSERDFSKVPTKEVHKKYKRYVDMGIGKPRLWFRCHNEDLDDWLHDAKGLKRAFGTDRCLFNE